MISPKDVHSLSDFQRNAKKMLKDLKKSKRPALLTVNGRGAAVVQDAAAYEAMLVLIDELRTLGKVREGIADVEAGRVVPLAEAAARWKQRAAALDRPKRRKNA